MLRNVYVTIVTVKLEISRNKDAWPSDAGQHTQRRFTSRIGENPELIGAFFLFLFRRSTAPASKHLHHTVIEHADFERGPSPCGASGEARMLQLREQIE
jgi:hypothetical protein